MVVKLVCNIMPKVTFGKYGTPDSIHIFLKCQMSESSCDICPKIEDKGIFTIECLEVK
jgi:hypothetical protein